MGEYLSTPKKEKDVVTGSNTTVIFTSLTLHLSVEVFCLRYAGLAQINGRCPHNSP